MGGVGWEVQGGSGSSQDLIALALSHGLEGGTGQEGSESSAMRLSCLHNRESPYFGELQELQADPVPRPGSWSEPKSTLMTMTREKNYFSTPISRMKESKGVLEIPRAGLDGSMSSF